ncbi:uncharacterized protein LOC144441486 isoform X2 [Glandiceps talaboti]
MTERSGTALPHILQEYNPEYSQDASASGRSPRPQEKINKKDDKETETTATTASPAETKEKHSGEKRSKSKTGKESPQKPISRESTSVYERRIEQQRNEENYQKWQEFKMVNRDQELDKLKQKVALQHELIQARDELYLQKQEEEKERQIAAREAERQKKLAKEEELVQICKESLDSDRQKKAARKAHHQAQQDHKGTSESQSGVLETDHFLANRPLSAIQSRSGDGESQVSTYTSLVSGYADFSREDTQASMLSEGEVTEHVLDELPEHKAELYRLFGAKQANYFLFPRIEPIKKKKIRVNPALRRHGGRSGADTLWSVLRSQSTVKLMRADSKIPAELKDAYGAFVRECLTRHKTVAKRSFYSETEVPESEKIQDSSYKERVKEMKHKIEVMFRSAQLNEDKTSILLFNNPPPDFNDLEGQEGPFRYHPSWIPDEEEEEEADYKKWLKTRAVDWPIMEGEEKVKEDTPRTEKSNGSKSKKSSSQPESTKADGSDAESEDSDDWLINMMINKPEEEVAEEKPKEKPPPKLVFLTENMCRSAGRFRQRMAEKQKKRDALLEPYQPQEAEPEETKPNPVPTIKAMSAVDRRKVLPPLQSQGNTPRSTRSKTAPPTADVPSPSTTARSSGMKKTSGWQPLTLHALTDYKPEMPVQGDGEFKHGQGEFWKPILS